MGYCAASDVGSLTKNILGSQTMFSSSTTPTIQEVNTWISTGCNLIETALNGGGYSTPVASTTTIYGHLRHCNSLYAAGMVELSRTNVTLAPGERTRGQVFFEMFEDCLSSLLKQDLTLAGITRQSSGKLYTGGISISDKQSRESDTDRVNPRFNRGQFDYPGTIGPNSGTAS